MIKITTWQWLKKSRKYLLFLFAFFIAVLALWKPYDIWWGMILFVFLINLVAWTETYLHWKELKARNRIRTKRVIK